MADSWGGSKVPRLRQQLVARDGLTCWRCGLPIVGETPTVDHVKPRSAGGTDDLANLRLAHHACNSSAQDRPQATLGSLDWMPQPKRDT